MNRQERIEAKTLREWLPNDFWLEFYDSPAAKLAEIEIECGYEFGWPGRHKNVFHWVVLKNGKAVGWNENPNTGWSFPVIKMKK